MSAQVLPPQQRKSQGWPLHNVETQLPDEQRSFWPQAWPQAPQLASSLCVSLHEPPQQFSLLVHCAVLPQRHIPPAHESARVVAQTMLQPPQLATSLVVPMHAPPQQDCDEPHMVAPHRPPPLSGRCRFGPPIPSLSPQPMRRTADPNATIRSQAISRKPSVPEQNEN